MVAHFVFDLVIAGNYFTDKRKMTDKPNYRVKNIDKVILSEYLDNKNLFELITAGNYSTD